MRNLFHILLGLVAVAAAIFIPNGSEAALAIAPVGISVKTAEQAAKHLSSFSGGQMSNYAGEDNYIGAGDDFVSFSGGSKSFVTEHRSALTFGFTVQNKTTTTKTFALLPTYLGSAAAIATYVGATCDGILSDGNFIGADPYVTGVASKSDLTIDGMQEFTLKHPTRVTQMILSANSDTFFDRSLDIYFASPFNKLENRYLNLTDYISPNQQIATKAVINLNEIFEDFQLNDQTIILMTLGGTNVVATTGELVNVQFKIGAVLNTASALKNKAIKAKQNALRG